MKRIIFYYCSLLVLIVGCKTETKQVENSPLDTSKIEVTTETTIDFPVVDFAEFETKYLHPRSDTTYVINFWATWCKPCVKELPAFESLHTNYKDQKVKVVLVSLDFPEHIEKAVIPFIKKRDLQSEVLLLDDPNANEWINKVSSDWSGAIPATIILKNDRKQFYERSFTYSELKIEVQSI